MIKFKHTPGRAVGNIKHQTGITGNRGQYKYWASFDWFSWYCVTPPVTPLFARGPHAPVDRRIFGREIKDEKLCIVCGEVHKTSDECCREPRERRMRDATVRRDDGYKLIQAENMGMFNDI